jgi:hypothetical protein
MDRTRSPSPHRSPRIGSSPLTQSESSCIHCPPRLKAPIEIVHTAVVATSGIVDYVLVIETHVARTVGCSPSPRRQATVVRLGRMVHVDLWQTHEIVSQATIHLGNRAASN